MDFQIIEKEVSYSKKIVVKLMQGSNLKAVVYPDFNDDYRISGQEPYRSILRNSILNNNLIDRKEVIQ